MSELSNDDKKAIWIFVDTLAEIINNYEVFRFGNGPIRKPHTVELSVLINKYAARYKLDPNIIIQSVENYIKDDSMKNGIW